MESTTNYDQFKSITSNREVDKRHVKSLTTAISRKNLLHLNPIICNKNMELVDGQHRLEAARALGVPVYYVIDDQVDKGDIATINSNSKNWSTMDYINYYAVEKKPGFDKLCVFLSEHQLIQPSTALMLLSSEGTRNTNALRQGIVDVGNYDFAVKVAGMIKDFRNHIDFAYDRNFVLAVKALASREDYDHSQMMCKVNMQPRSLVKCINAKQYQEMLIEIYNYRSSKNRLN